MCLLVCVTVGFLSHGCVCTIASMCLRQFSVCMPTASVAVRGEANVYSVQYENHFRRTQWFPLNGFGFCTSLQVQSGEGGRVRCTCVCVCVCVCVNVCECVCVCVQACMHTRICVFLFCICMCTGVHVHTCQCMCIYYEECFVCKLKVSCGYSLVQHTMLKKKSR